MEKRKCVVFGAGEYYGKTPTVTGEYTVAADGGWKQAVRFGIVPQGVIGDFDSSRAPCGMNTTVLNPVKDETDTAEAVRLGLEAGCDEFHIYGGTGGRTAHTLANLQLLASLAKAGKRGYLYGNGEIFTVIHNASIRFTADSAGYVSVFTVDTESRGVYEKGLKYVLQDYRMMNTNPIGTSNEFTGEPSEVGVRDGTLLIVFTEKATVIA